jgi:hypothetical protein
LRYTAIYTTKYLLFFRQQVIMRTILLFPVWLPRVPSSKKCLAINWWDLGTLTKSTEKMQRLEAGI